MSGKSDPSFCDSKPCKLKLTKQTEDGTKERRSRDTNKALDGSILRRPESNALKVWVSIVLSTTFQFHNKAHTQKIYS